MLVKKGNGNGNICRNRSNELPTMGSFLNDFYGKNVFNDLFNETVNIKNYNLLETDESYELSLVLPGFSKEEINIEIKDDLITISSVVEETEENENYIKRGFIKSSFERSFSVVENIDLENIGAKMENGILTISLGKIKFIENKTKNRKIDIL